MSSCSLTGTESGSSLRHRPVISIYGRSPSSRWRGNCLCKNYEQPVSTPSPTRLQATHRSVTDRRPCRRFRSNIEATPGKESRARASSLSALPLLTLLSISISPQPPTIPSFVSMTRCLLWYVPSPSSTLPLADAALRFLNGPSSSSSKAHPWLESPQSPAPYPQPTRKKTSTPPRSFIIACSPHHQPRASSTPSRRRCARLRHLCAKPIHRCIHRLRTLISISISSYPIIHRLHLAPFHMPHRSRIHIDSPAVPSAPQPIRRPLRASSGSPFALILARARVDSRVVGDSTRGSWRSQDPRRMLIE